MTDTAWDIVNRLAPELDGIAEWSQDRSDPEIFQIRLGLKDGGIAYLADEHDDDGEIDGWSFSTYLDEGELEHRSPMDQGGGRGRESLRRWLHRLSDEVVEAISQ